MQYLNLKSFRTLGLLISFTIFAPTLFAGVVDSTFNAQVQTAAYSGKNVQVMVTQPDGKVIASGNFNNYNGQPVGRLIRLTAGGALDSTFNNDIFAPDSFPASDIVLQPDGKLLILGTFTLSDGTEITNSVIRLKTDGTRDTSFVFPLGGFIYDIKFDAAGRIVVGGYPTYSENGSTIQKSFVRLLDSGAIDPSFNSPAIPSGLERFTVQGNKLIYTTFDVSGQPIKMFRFNEDGSYDSTFTPTPLGNFQILRMAAQPDGAILVLADNRVFRVGPNGGLDGGFLTTTFVNQPLPRLSVRPDGGFTLGYRTSSPAGHQFKRFLASGAVDATFTTYNYPTTEIGTFAVEYDGGVVIGDSDNGSLNRFVHLLPSGAVDTAYNPGGAGFQSIASGIIRSIFVLPDDKILIGGNFDRVNGAVRFKIARLNADSTLDTGFQINTTANGNYFSAITDIYRITRQTDGKLLVSGDFTYLIGGGSHRNVVRLNADGSIDPTFILNIDINNMFGSTGLSSNKAVLTSTGGVVVGTTRSSVLDPTPVPLFLTGGGLRDTTAGPSIYASKNSVAAFEIALQPDGRLIVAGRHVIGDVNGSTFRGFITRLNSNGTLDSTFQPYETPDRIIEAVSVRPNGQIVAVARATASSSLLRLNADGTVDPTFAASVNGKLNTLVVLPDNRVVVGGLFTTLNGLPRQNVAQLNADGTPGEELGGVNREVLTLAVDNQGRILIGGMFTAIRDGAQQVSRAYVARLLATNTTVRAPVFDFDGDGKTDLSIFRPSNGEWWINRSSTSATGAAQFGVSTDLPVAADFTGDGKTDIAFFRPSTGEWFVLRSENSSFYSVPFGTGGDIPSVGDFDADGKSDLAIFRPSTSTWFIQKSAGGVAIFGFGASGDKPLTSDFDGDGKTDVAVFRPSTGEWWIKRSSNDSVYAFRFGTATDKPTPGDFTGDGKADAAFFRPSTGEWFILRSEDSSFFSFPFGTAGDLAVPGDYDGDGKFDAAVFRPSSSTWYINRSTAGIMIAGFGATGDAPVPNAFVR